MNRRIYSIFVSLLLMFLIPLTGCGKNEVTKDTDETQTTVEMGGMENKIEGNIIIAAAASLTDALSEIKPLFEEKYGATLDFTFGASGALQKQIQEGAPVDVFISASTKNMTTLVDEKLIDENTVEVILGNSLVLITPTESKIKSINDLVQLNDEIAIGETETVPAGQYTKEALENLGLWEALQSKFVFGKDVRAVLSYVSSAEAGAGFVYKTDTIGEENIILAEEIDSSLHKPIDYPIGILNNIKNREASEAFVLYLNTNEAKEIFEKYGFKIR